MQTAFSTLWEMGKGRGCQPMLFVPVRAPFRSPLTGWVTTVLWWGWLDPPLAWQHCVTGTSDDITPMLQGWLSYWGSAWTRISHVSRGDEAFWAESIKVQVCM